VRADAIVLNSALSAYARNRPPLRTPKSLGVQITEVDLDVDEGDEDEDDEDEAGHPYVDDEAQEAVDEDEDDDL